MRQPGGLLGIGGAPHPNLRSRHRESFVSQTFFHRRRAFGHRENSVPACVLPGLRQRQTAHHMPRPYRETGIGANQKYTWFHRVMREP